MTNQRSGRAAAMLLFLLVVLVGAGLAAAAPPAKPPSAARPIASGGGEVTLNAGDELSEAERSRIQAEIDANIARLEQAGALPRASAQVSLSFPLRQAAGFDDPGFYGISGFVDHNPNYPNAKLDYYCGSRTYDTSGGYNHQGTDFFSWPFAWNKTNAGAIEVVAAAPGTIIYREDGNQDRSCSMNGSRWNAVYIRQADGSIAWYGHLKRGSLTGKGVGMTVATGEYLGLVGSSGNSTGPHLHFELYQEYWNLRDPFAGACNATTTTTWWVNQQPYVDPALLKVMTGTAAVQWASCPNEDITHEADTFRPGDTIYFTTFFRDRSNTMPSVQRILRPDGSVWREWSHTSPQTYSLSYWWWAYKVEVDAPTGEWQYEVSFNGRTYGHRFRVAVPSTPTPTATATATPMPTATVDRSLLTYSSYMPLSQR